MGEKGEGSGGEGGGKWGRGGGNWEWGTPCPPPHRKQEKDTPANWAVLISTCMFEVGSYAGSNHIQMHEPENA